MNQGNGIELPARQFAVDCPLIDMFAPFDLQCLRFLSATSRDIEPFIGKCAAHAAEDALAYDGGADGADTLRRVIAESPAWLRRGGALVLELSKDQADLIADDLRTSGFDELQRIIDEDGDLRGISATRS